MLMKNTVGMGRLPWTRIGMAALLVGASRGVVFAFGYSFDPIPMTREAELVVVGKVVTLKDKSIDVRVNRTIKGSVKGSTIEVLWDRQPRWEFTPASYKEGQDLLLFLKPSGAVYEPVHGPAGTLDLSADDAATYPEVIDKLLEFDRAATADARNAVLKGLLARKDRAARINALHLIGQEHEKRRLSPGPLKDAVTQLTADPDAKVAGNAVQALGDVGDKSSVPTLINLLRSPDQNVSKGAHSILKRWTGAKIEVDSKGPSEKREKSIKAWQDWWEKNKDKTKLRR
ncbi:MAG: HEAT repeat domain-containing protein [Elusimicrobia bacterium]|nr:HEAT repeat domain-containing protein [Elusimicrobiota bacterium]